MNVSWGVLGCGGIAGSRFVPGIRLAEGARLVAAASRTPGKAKDFAGRHRLASHYDRYEDLLSRDDIEAVYVATTHNLHFQTVALALEHGKHVLCEKPFTVNAREAKELIRLSRAKKLFMMEGMWTRFLPAIVRLRSWLDEGRIGEVRQLRADFGMRKAFDPDHRLYSPALAGGALLDAGIYPVSFASMVMKAAPTALRALASFAPTGVDEESAYLLQYGGGRIALLSAAIRTTLNNRAEIAGSEGRLVLPPPFHKAQSVELYRNGEEPLISRHPYVEDEGFRWEIEEASMAIRAGRLESEVMPLDETLSIMETIDEIKKQLGLVYGNDR